MKLTSNTTTYELSLKELKELFAEKLECKVEQLSITEKSIANYDSMDRSPTTYTFDGLKVTVKKLP